MSGAMMYTFEGEWKPWFAWFPVKILESHGTTTWLRRIERRKVICVIPKIGMTHHMYDYRWSRA